MSLFTKLISPSSLLASETSNGFPSTQKQIQLSLCSIKSHIICKPPFQSPNTHLISFSNILSVAQSSPVRYTGSSTSQPHCCLFAFTPPVPSAQKPLWACFIPSFKFLHGRTRPSQTPNLTYDILMCFFTVPHLQEKGKFCEKRGFIGLVH